MNYKLKIGDYAWFSSSKHKIQYRQFLLAVKSGHWSSNVDNKEELTCGSYLIVKKFTMQSKLIKAMYAEKL